MFRLKIKSIISKQEKRSKFLEKDEFSSIDFEINKINLLKTAEN